MSILSIVNINCNKEELLNNIKIAMHAFVIPIGLLNVTSNILFTIAYILFTSFVYTKILNKEEDKSSVADIVLFANKLYFIAFLFILFIITIPMIIG